MNEVTYARVPAAEVLNVLKPGTQNFHVLHHLVNRDKITQVEAHELYRVYRLASRVNDLKNLGVSVHARTRFDFTGRRYVEYSLN